jgi:hypothetical protein
MKFLNRTARILVPLPGCQLLPGKNDLPHIGEKELKAIRQNPQFQSWLQLGWVKDQNPGKAPIPEPAPKPAPEPEPEPEPAPAPEPEPAPELDPRDRVKAMPTADARLVIAECEDPELLLDWFERDDRKTVHGWIESRLRHLEHSE